MLLIEKQIFIVIIKTKSDIKRSKNKLLVMVLFEIKIKLDKWEIKYIVKDSCDW